MAKFCRYCGKQLEEGTECTCTQKSVVANQPDTEEVVNNPQPEVIAQPAANNYQAEKGFDFQPYIKGLWDLFKAFVKKPVSVGAKFINKCDFKYALYIIILQSVLTALFAISIAGKFNSVIKRAAGAVGGIMGGTFEGALEANIAATLFPIPSIFIITFISSFIMALLLALVMMMFIKMLKANTNYKYMICASSINSLVIIPFVLAGIVLSLIMPLNVDVRSMSSVSGIANPVIIPLCVSCLGLTLGNFIILSSAYGGCSADKDKMPYVMFFTGIVMAIVFMIIVKTVTPMCMPSGVNAALNGINSYSNSIGSLFN